MTFSPEVQAILDRVNSGARTPTMAERRDEDRAKAKAARARTPSPRKKRTYVPVPADQRRPPGPPRAITGDRLAEAVERRKAGESYATIAADFDVSANTVRRAVAETNVPRGGTLDKELAYLQRASGMKIRDIAHDHGVGESTVRLFLKSTDLADKRDPGGNGPAATCRACGQPKPPGLCKPCQRRRMREWQRKKRSQAS